MTLLISDISKELSGTLIGDVSLRIIGINSLQYAVPGEIGFISHDRYLHLLDKYRGSALIIAERHLSLVPSGLSLIVVDDVYLAYAKLTQLWRQRHQEKHLPLIHPTAVIHSKAWVDSTVQIGPLAVIEAGVQIGQDTVIASRVSVGTDTQIGERCIVHAGVVLGADGFGFAKSQHGWQKIEQLGNVIIGHDVELGANTCIDRAALGITKISDGVKIDNLVQIGHNVQVGAHTAIAGCVGIAGSAKIGSRCTLGGGSIVLGHLELVDDVHISAASVVMKSIKSSGHYSGLFPIDRNADWEKNAATLKHLHGLRDKIRFLEKQINMKEKS